MGKESAKNPLWKVGIIKGDHWFKKIVRKKGQGGIEK